MLEELLMAFINGILLGGVLALLAFGLNLIFGVVKIIHMAYGQFVMLGFYFIYYFHTAWHMPLLVAMAGGIVVMGLLGMLVQLLIINPLLNAPRLNQLLALASLIIVLENLAQVLWGADYRGIPISMPIIQFGDIFIRSSYLLAFLGAIATLGILYLFLHKTYFGLAIRSVAQDVEIAKGMGINPKVIYYITLAAGGALTGVVAAFFIPIYTVHPHFGASFTLMAFVIVVFGGMGNLMGGFISAFIIGVVTSITAVLTSTEVADILALVLFILMMMVRPQGILGAKA
ncbi:MAG: branched-chain amino acid ABC transporter permease [Proteobacteria bacterium]|nr:branched-chain amino acid ABC transporter permease [Pseudomonadota bacterium]MBU4276885.1 branched-chain amino acid ABC transporter permease [Pseudomonadota bacterium]MBU4383204.1 branched-chain amino acid ABC transporter permease [Pseudomonadota bacterium]MCG2764244.1 branched-chain amino acid ABC transporter permease [Desulfarculaceae bacterium]